MLGSTSNYNSTYTRNVASITSCRDEAYFVPIYCITIDEGNGLALFRSGAHTLGGSGVDAYDLQVFRSG